MSDITLPRVRKNLSDLLSNDEKTTVSRRSSGVSSFGGTDLDKERGTGTESWLDYVIPVSYIQYVDMRYTGT